MKSRSSFIRRLFLVALLLGLAFGPEARAASKPNWEFPVPDPTSFNSTSSIVSTTAFDAAGDTFLVLTYSATIEVVDGIFVPVPAGVQIFLLNPKGKILGALEMSGNMSVIPVFISSKRIIASMNGTLRELKVDKKAQTLTATDITLSAAGETPVISGAQTLSPKYQLTSVTASGFVTEIRRYLYTRLLP